MESSIQVFSNEEFSVRTTQDADGTVWFVGRDIAYALEYSESSMDSINKLFAPVPEVWKGRKRFLTPGISANRVGRIAKEYGIKAPEGESNEYGRWVFTKSRYSNHECASFIYNAHGLERFRHIVSEAV